jgi:Neprosin
MGAMGFQRNEFTLWVRLEDIMNDAPKTGGHKRSKGRDVPPAHDTVVTTTTETGRLLDWVPIESQVPDGRVATPPPPARTPRSTRSARPGPATTPPSPVSFELQDPAAKRGPKGTVPVLRDLADHRRRVARRGADKKGFRGRREPGARDNIADPNPFGYYHATSGQSGTFYGCQANIAVYTPVIETNIGGDDHSLMQFGLQNYDLPQSESLEAGWTVDAGLNGNTTPHVFTYYTTNGYSQDGDNLGGYNQTVAGWVQYDPNVHPGATINGTSVIGGPQAEVSMKYQLWQGNWWFQVQGIWLGYYPGALFGSLFFGPALAEHASWVGFWGEVDSLLADPTQTADQMGSGEFGDAGWPYAGYQHNVQVQSGSDGTMTDLNGFPSAEDSSYYDIVQTMLSGTNWASYFFAGGSGAGTTPPL